MTQPMKITLELDADDRKLIEGLLEADTAIRTFARSEKKTLDDAGDESGRSFGRKFRHGVEEENALSGIFGGILRALPALAMPAGMTGLIFGAAQAVAAIAPAVGAIGLLPAAAMGAALGLGTLITAFHGLGDALKNSGDPAKYAEALKKLAPAAQEVVKQMVALKPALHQIHMDVQTGFFRSMANDIRVLAGQYMPLLRSEFAASGAALGDMVHQLALMIHTPQFFDSMYQSMTNVVVSIRNASGGLAHLVNAFTTIAKVGSSFLPGLGRGFADLAARFDAFITRLDQSGALHDFIQTGLDTLKLLMPLVKDLWNILSPIIKALTSTNTGGGLGFLGTLLHQLAEFLNSAQGMKMLTSLFRILGDVFGVLGQALMLLLPILGQIIEALEPLFAAKEWSDLVAELGKALEEMVVALIPLLPPLIKLTIALIPVLIPLLQLLADGFVVLMPIVLAIVQGLNEALIPALRWLAEQLQWLADKFDSVLKPITDFEEKIRAALFSVGFWKGVGHWFAGVWGQITGAIHNGIETIKHLPDIVRTTFNNFVQFIGFGIGAAIKELTRLPTQMVHIMNAMWSALIALFHHGWNALVAFVKSAGPWLVHFFMGLGPAIVNAVRGAEKWLYETGKNIIMGLINGVKSMFDTAVNVVANFAHNIWTGFQRGLGIHSPSKVFETGGIAIVAGLVKGINENAHSAVNAVANMLSFGGGRGIGIPAFAVGGAGGGFGGAGGGGQPAVIQNHVHVYLDGKELHSGLIQPAQRYKLRTGTTGLT